MFRIRDIYYSVVPYDYRPHNIIYNIKHWFRPYNVVKCRYLEKTWNDRDILLAHTMFEILSQFIEKECCPEHIDWKSSGHIVKVSNKNVNVRDEMQDLYNWWHKIYNKSYPKKHEQLWKRIEKCNVKLKSIPKDKDGQVTSEKSAEYFSLDLEYRNPKQKLLYKKLLKEVGQLDQDMHNELLKRMERLVRVSPFLWT